MMFLFLFGILAITFVFSSNVEDGKLIIVTCSPHISHFTVIFPIAEAFSKRLGENDVLWFGGSMEFKDRVDKSPNMKFFHLYSGIESHWEQHIIDNREARWKDNSKIWPGVSQIIGNLNFVIRSTFVEFETVERRMKEFEVEIGKPDLVLVDPIAAGGKSYAVKEGINHVLISPSIQSPHPYQFGFPGYFGVSTVEEMTFFRSIVENVFWMVIFLVKSFRLLIDPRGVFKAYMDKTSAPQIVTSFIGFDYPTHDTLTHFTKYVGFIPFRRTEPELSEELLEFLDSHPNTAFVSSGTSILWPTEAVEGIYRTLEKLNISVVASVNPKARVFYEKKKKLFESSSYQNHVRFENWVNQYQLLKHPSIKLFVTHGGAGGMAETIDNEVPVLVVPIASDQFANSVRAEERGIGERIKYMKDFNNGVFEEKLRKIYFEGEKYRKNLKKINKVSRMHGGVESTADFLEEILVMDGYEHLRTFQHPHVWKIRGIFISVVVLVLLFVFLLGCFCSSKTPRKSKIE